MAGNVHTLRRSVYADHGRKLFELGLAPIPIQFGTKRPAIEDWQRYSHHKMTIDDVVEFEQIRGAGIGLVLGAQSGICCIDIDIDDDDVNSLVVEVFPHTPLAKRGEKGYTLFFRRALNMQSTKIALKGTRNSIVDVLDNGKQTVIPPTMHPDAEEPYYWLIEGDRDVAELLTELPRINMDMVNALHDGLARLGLADEREASKPGNPPSAGHEVTLWSDLNRKALDNLDAWVPELGLLKTHRKRSGDYVAVASWRPSAKTDDARTHNIGFHRQSGIRDFGAGVSMSPLDVVAAVKMSSLDEAVSWLQRRVDPEAAAEATKTVKLVPRAKEDIEGDFDVELPGHLYDSLDGLTGHLFEWLSESVPTAPKSVCLSAALAYMGAFLGRKYVVKTPATDSPIAMNIYAVSLAPTGAGKSLVASKLKTLDAEVGGAVLAPDKVASGPAILSHLLNSAPSALFRFDEVGALLQGAANKNSAHATTRQELLELYGVGTELHYGKARANVEDNSGRIHSPCCTVLGSSVPSEFYKAITGDDVTSGLLNRFLILHAKRLPRIDEAAEDAAWGDWDGDQTSTYIPVPAMIKEAFQKIMSLAGAGDFATQDLTRRPKVRRATPDLEARRELLAILRFQKEQVAKGEDEGTTKGPLYARFFENTCKLAAIKAIGRNPEKPAITVDDVRWAGHVTNHAILTAAFGVDNFRAENDHHSLMNAVLGHLERAKAAGLTTKQLREAKGVYGKAKPREFNEAIESLEAAGKIVVERRTKGARFWSTRFVDVAAGEAQEG